MCMENIYRPYTGFAVVKMYLLNISAVVKPCMAVIHRYSTGSAVVKTSITICYRHSTGFALIKTGLLNFYSPSTGNGVFKTS